MLFRAEKSVGWCCSWGCGVGRVRAPGRFPGYGQAPVGAVGPPFAAHGGMERCARCGRSGSIRRATSPSGGHDSNDPGPTAVGVAGSCGGGGQAADLSVAQPVEDQSDEFPGGSDLTMLVPRRAPT
jgi:hypothetical protein